MNQNDTVKLFLKKNKAITQRDATKLGIMRLASRIHDLRKTGNAIESKLITVYSKSQSRYTQVSSYSIKK